MFLSAFINMYDLSLPQFVRDFHPVFGISILFLGKLIDKREKRSYNRFCCQHSKDSRRL